MQKRNHDLKVKDTFDNFNVNGYYICSATRARFLANPSVRVPGRFRDKAMFMYDRESVDG